MSDIYTMAVFDEKHFAHMVMTEHSAEECKRRAEEEFSTWINIAGQRAGGAVEQFLVFCKWHYYIAHDGQIIEEGRIENLPEVKSIGRQLKH